MINLGKNLGTLIRVSRALHKDNITQLRLAHEIGCHPQYINNVERGKCGMNALKLVKLPDILGLTIEGLHEAIMKDYSDALWSAIDQAIKVNAKVLDKIEVTNIA